MSTEDLTPDLEFVSELTQLAYAANPLARGEIVSIAVPHNHTLRVLDLSDLGDVPRRKRGITKLHTPGSFVEFVKDAKPPTGTRLYADSTSGRIAAIFNDAGWRDHGAEVTLKLTRQWKDWHSIDGKLMEQDEFAEFLDNHRPDVESPSGADLLEIVQTLQVHKDAHYSKASRLENGEVQFTYNEAVDGKAGRDSTTVIPSEVELLIPVYEGSDKVLLPGFFRYKLRAGSLRVGVKLLNPDRIRDDHFEEVTNNVGQILGMVALLGDVPSTIQPEQIA